MTDEMTSKPEWLKDLQVLTLGPNDHLVIRTSTLLSEAATQHLRDLLQRTFPGRAIVILGPGVDIGVIRPTP